MEAEARRKLSMAARVMDFATAHPFTDAGYTAVVATLQERIGRADALAEQEAGGQDGERAAIGQRSALRAGILQRLRHLVQVARMAAATHPELAGLFRLPNPNSAHKTFITAAKTMLTAATAEKDLFISLALGETFLDDLTTAVAEFDAATTTAHGGRANHVGAHADILAIANECCGIVRVLDGFNRTRFKDDPELLAAWESARNVAGPFRVRKTPPAPPATGGTAAGM